MSFYKISILCFLPWMVFGHNESDKRVLKVYNGGEVMNHYPFMAAIFINTSKGWMYACGGTVIAREWILTAAHCLEEMVQQPKRLVLAKDLLVLVGTKRVKQPLDTTHMRRFVAAYFTLKDVEIGFNGIRRGDVALLQLKYPLLFGEKINRIVIPKAKPSLAEGQIIGWGMMNTSANSQPAILQSLIMNLIWSVEGCKARISDADDKERFDETQLCAYSLDAGACEGDSGGPLFRAFPHSRSILLGLVSMVQECNYEGENIGIFVNVIKCCDWIQKITGIDDICVDIPDPKKPDPATISAADMTKLAFCEFCPIALDWVKDFLDDPQGKDLEPTVFAGRVAEKCASYSLSEGKIKNRSNCKTTVYTIVLTELKKVKENAIKGKEAELCKNWFPTQECIAMNWDSKK